MTYTKEQLDQIKNIAPTLDEIEKLTKSYLSKLNKTEDGMPPEEEDQGEEASVSEEGGDAPIDDATEDLVHAADEGADAQSLEEYVAQIPPEEIDALIEALQAAKGEEGMEDGAENLEQSEDTDPLLADAAGAMGEEGMESDGSEDIAQLVQELSPEEREQLQQALAQAQQVQPSEPPAESLEQSELANAMQNLNKSMNSIKREIDSLKKSVNTKRVETPAAVIPSTARVASEKTEVLEKSEQSLSSQFNSGLDLANHLYEAQKNGNKLVKSMHVTKANLAKSPDEIENVIKEAKKLGVKF